MIKTLQFLASKFAEASASTRPPSADSSAADARAPSIVVFNAPGTQLRPTPVSTALGANAPLFAAATTGSTARPTTLIPSLAKLPVLSALSFLGAQGSLAGKRLGCFGLGFGFNALERYLARTWRLRQAVRALYWYQVRAVILLGCFRSKACKHSKARFSTP